MTYALGPIKPRKKPKPKKISFQGDLYGWIDASEELEEGVELFTCTQDEPALFELVESGTYLTTTNLEVTVIDGIIDEVAS
jgi:hypothetical protein